MKILLETIKNNKYDRLTIIFNDNSSIEFNDFISIVQDENFLIITELDSLYTYQIAEIKQIIAKNVKKIEISDLPYPGV